MKILNLSRRKEKILKTREEEWRQESHLAWIKGGDNNTKYFDQATSKRKQQNMIWTITNEYGITLSSPMDINMEDFQHYKELFMDRDIANMINKLDLINHFPLMVNDNDTSLMEA